MAFEILGLGTANPPGKITADEGLRVAQALHDPIVARSSSLNDIYANAGVQTRHMVHGRDVVKDVLEGTKITGSPFLPGADPRGPSTAARMKMYAAEAPKIAVEAARVALADSGVSPDEIEHLVTISCTGFAAPGVDERLIRELGLRPTTQRVHVGYMGCHAAINGLRTVSALAEQSGKAVLMVAVELSSLHYYYGISADKVVANALFADGAAAIVGKAGTTGDRVAATGSMLIPNSTEVMGWIVGDHGFEMILSKKIPGLIEHNLRGWLEPWLLERGHSLESVGSWAVHPGGPRILTAVENSLKLQADALAESWGVLRDYGNMSSPTVLFIAERLRARHAPKPWVLLGFGPGLVAEVAVVE